MTLNASEFAAFEILVADTSGKRELECGPFLKHAGNLLIQRSICSAVTHYEIRSHAGDADLILVAEVQNDIGKKEKVAVHWELKAPQCYLFEYDDNKNRCRPTKDLIKAENQLLHYVEESFANDLTRTMLGVQNRSDIRPGGIIIGTKDTMLRSPKCARDVYKAELALRLRSERLYQAQGIRVLLWDRVLDALRPSIVF